jgi:hypothetical protein
VTLRHVDYQALFLQTKEDIVCVITGEAKLSLELKGLNHLLFEEELEHLLFCGFRGDHLASHFPSSLTHSIRA